MVAGQDAEAAGVDRQALGETELEGEVRDRQWRLRVHEARVAVVVLPIRRARALERLPHLLALTCTLDALLAQLGEQEDRVLARRLPEIRVERTEEGFDSRLPRPQQVVSELVKFFEHAHKILVREEER